MFVNFLLMYLNWREICPLRMPKTCSTSFQIVVSYGKRVRFPGPCHRTANLGFVCAYSKSRFSFRGVCTLMMGGTLLTSATGRQFDSWVFVEIIQMGSRIRGNKCHIVVKSPNFLLFLWVWVAHIHVFLPIVCLQVHS